MTQASSRGGSRAGAAEHGDRSPTLGTRIRGLRFLAIWPATAILFAISPLIASSSLSSTALLSMLPFAALLALAAAGQTLVIQQRGFDLSVAGMVSLSSTLVCTYPATHGFTVATAILLVCGVAIVTGLVSGFAIAVVGITPLIATLAMNALLGGVVLSVTNGGGVSETAPKALQSFASGKVIGVPNTVVVAVVVLVALAGVLSATVLGRRFVAVGVNPVAARAAGIRVRRYEVGTYVVASLLYAAMGILLAGVLANPGTDAGDIYLLSTVAAVVLGGTSLSGGRGSVIASGVAALFLTQLESVVLGSGENGGSQLVVQGAIIAAGMIVRAIPWRSLRGGSIEPGEVSAGPGSPGGAAGAAGGAGVTA